MRYLLLLFLAIAAGTLRAETGSTVVADRHVVVSVEKHASEVGLAVLDGTGSAVDAAVAMALAMAVTHPAAGNIGGGGFMLIHPTDGEEPVCIDYRETAPAAATATTFTLGESRHTHRVVAVPGTLRGLALAHDRYGRRPWSELVQPAARLAAEGFPVSAALATSLNAALAASEDLPTAKEFRRVFAPPDRGQSWTTG